MTAEYLLRLALAAAVGAAIGAEREYRDKAAGLRTIMLITLGSCLFTVLSQELVTVERGDPTRISGAIVSGVGFLGAGVIFRRGSRSTGITTAATIWCAAALGMGIGGGRLAVSLITAAGILIVLWVLPPVERFIDNQRETKTYEMRTQVGSMSIEALHDLFTAHDLTVFHCSHGKRDDLVVSEFHASGKHDDHTRMTHDLIGAPWLVQLSS